MPQLDMYSIDNNGLDGPDGVKFASGTIPLIFSNNLNFSKRSGGSSSSPVANYIEVSGLWFVPSKIIVTRPSSTGSVVSTYVKETSGGASVTCRGDNVYNATSPAYVDERGFLIPVWYPEGGTPTFTWYAYS